MQFDLVIKNGTTITGGDSFPSDLGINGEKITALGTGLSGQHTIDASGLYVLPGGIDPHVHLQMPVGATISSDTWYTGSLAAACGGTTTIIDFVEPAPDQTLLDALSDRRKEADGQAVIDYGLHMTLCDANPNTLQQIPGMVNSGCSTFKTYLTYAGFKLDDASFLKVLTTVQAAGGLVMVHAENDAIIEHLKQKYLSEGKTTPRMHALSRPASSEGEAVTRALAMAEACQARLYVVHISTDMGARAVQAARKRGVNVYGETCPQYLLLDEDALDQPHFEGAKFVCSPPLRTKMDNEALWSMLSGGVLDTVGTDHCPFNFEGQKTLGGDRFDMIPGGLPGIESRLALIHTFGVCSGRISLNRWVELCSTNPARIFNLYPQKGSLLPGSDADIVLFDPKKKVTIKRTMLHENVDYTPYEGLVLTGYPVMTIARGRTICKEGRYYGEGRQGKFLAT
jgi:dihydropyrimidinase